MSEFLATVWPRSLPTDLGSQRRKKYVVRSANLTLAVLVTLAVAGTIVSEPRELPIRQAAGLALAGVLYIAWSLRLMGHVVRGFLWERGAGRAALLAGRLGGVQIAGLGGSAAARRV